MRLIIIATDLADKESEGKDISEGRERLFVSNRATKKAVGWKGRKKVIELGAHIVHSIHQARLTGEQCEI